MRVPLVSSDETGKEGEEGSHLLLLAARFGKGAGVAGTCRMLQDECQSLVARSGSNVLLAEISSCRGRSCTMNSRMVAASV
ncbi:hypothetical protein NEUTE1DRAFT_47371 [Neurospora tetrasperma FGSC 2508]|uniref:Uncharacterized protein n=1 Tax=Neurospora tetrasperma (strain FGSC 2508 / ATCC MYA-4615 / P0657) TaxID=510951 RepID=F8MTM4_NEUT8|nr:uncharacterized protein NEUTE1DRAFT_47371 [Neurospora tetrasperma FGSC 2508]EGO55356.1 hypothetical protein NEUTE1DRAFT_47371 [Neurospora tetrasperma FGSC 2508]EGZ69418.1 hypothetical protein NEUTE2DRAFT_71234 [Neurospora tetrasperma FGSC 2509]